MVRRRGGIQVGSRSTEVLGTSIKIGFEIGVPNHYESGHKLGR